jgi:hypothetical protein
MVAVAVMVAATIVVVMLVDACSRTWWLSVQAYASMKPLTCHSAIECADQFPTL